MDRVTVRLLERNNGKGLSFESRRCVFDGICEISLRLVLRKQPLSLIIGGPRAVMSEPQTLKTLARCQIFV